MWIPYHIGLLESNEVRDKINKASILIVKTIFILDCENTIYISSLCRNLIFVSRLMQVYFSFYFENMFSMSQNKWVIGTESLIDDLFKFDINYFSMDDQNFEHECGIYYQWLFF